MGRRLPRWPTPTPLPRRPSPPRSAASDSTGCWPPTGCGSSGWRPAACASSRSWPRKGRQYDDAMGTPRETRQVSEWIDRPTRVVYEFASDPAHLPEWAAGLGGAVERVGDEWFVESPMGRVGLRFAPPN